MKDNIISKRRQSTQEKMTTKTGYERGKERAVGPTLDARLTVHIKPWQVRLMRATCSQPGIKEMSWNSLPDAMQWNTSVNKKEQICHQNLFDFSIHFPPKKDLKVAICLRRLPYFLRRLIMIPSGMSRTPPQRRAWRLAVLLSWPSEWPKES